eukprot:s2223_g14.t1
MTACCARYKAMSRSRAPRPRHGGARVCHDGYDAPTWATVSGGADAPVLATRALPLEHALAMLARVCREAAARVAWNGRLAEMNLDVPVGDERRIEAVLKLQALRRQVPPVTGRLPPTNSWLYMPLLLDGAGLLSPPAADAWRSRAPYADTWPALVTTLAASAPVRATDLADADPGATTEDCTHVCTCVGAQPTARLTLRQAVHAAAGADGYLTAPSLLADSRSASLL